MKMKKAIILFCVVFVVSRIAIGSMPFFQDDTKKKKRVRRPEIKKDDSVYFENVFKDALVGERPEPAKAGQSSNSKMTNSNGGSKANQTRRELGNQRFRMVENNIGRSLAE